MDPQLLGQNSLSYWSRILTLVMALMVINVNCIMERPANVTGKRKEPRVISHVVNSIGPGWIDFHFKVEHLGIAQLTIEIKYHKLKYEEGDIEIDNSEHWKIIHVDFNGPQEFSMPTYPCPVWFEKGLYCVLLTDYIRPDPDGRLTFSDYVIEIKVHRGILREDTNFHEVMKSEGYRTIVRVWEDCNPAISNCQNLWHFARKKWAFKTFDSPPMDEAHQITEHTTETTLPATSPRPAIVKVRKLWPLFLLLFLIVLLVFLPWFYIAMRRRTKQKVMNTWYCWTSPDGTSFLMSIPDAERKKKMYSSVHSQERPRAVRRKKCKRFCGGRRSART